MIARSRLSSCLGIGLLAIAASVALTLPAEASAATSGGRIYWTGFGFNTSTKTDVAGKIQFGALSGAGGYQTLFTEPTEEVAGKVDDPELEGIALDPAAGKIYWTSGLQNEIRVANLDGEGSPQTLYKESSGYPDGLTVDAANGKLYWTNHFGGEIVAANLNGEGTPQTLYTEPSGSEPTGIVVDQAAGRLYWTDYETGEIRVGGLGGEPEMAAETLYTEPLAGTTKPRPAGIGVDPATGRLYWTDEGTSQIRVGGLGGEPEMEAETLYTEPEKSGVWGVALVPATGRLYWADYETGEIRTGGIGGPSELAASTLFTETPNIYADFPAVLNPPSATGAPVLSGARAVGSPLSCSQGSWASDMPEASYYQAPQSFSYQWTRDGVAVSGATSQTFTPTEGGSYVCDVSAANAAGSTAQGSAAAVVPAPAPSAAITAPASGGSYIQGEAVASTFACVEGAGGPGLASCDDSNGTSTVSGGAGHLETATLGAHTYTVTATSKDGLTGTASISYTVVPKAEPKPRPRVVKLLIGAKALVKGGKARLSLACKGDAKCAGELVLKARVKVKAKGKGRHGKARFKMIVLGRASFAIAAGHHRVLNVKLSKTAIKLLKAARHHRLKAKAVAKVKGGKSAHRTVKLV